MAEEASVLPGYEITIITKTELSDAGLTEVRERFGKLVTEYKGKVIVHEDWGRRRLGYKIKKESRGHYTYFAFTGKKGVVAEAERLLRINENVLRFLTVKLDDEFDAARFKKDHVNFLGKGTRAEAQQQFERNTGGRDRDRDRDFGKE